MPAHRLQTAGLLPIRFIDGAGYEERGIRFAHDLYGAFPVKSVVVGLSDSSLFGAGKAVLRPVACDQVPGARGRGQGTETLAKLGGFAA